MRAVGRARLLPALVLAAGCLDSTGPRPMPPPTPGPDTGSGEAPAPVLGAVDHDSVVAGGPVYTLTVTGSGFADRSRVFWNGSLLPTTVVSATTLTASLATADLPAPDTAEVVVRTTGPGGGTSAARAVRVVPTTEPVRVDSIVPGSGAEVPAGARLLTAWFGRAVDRDAVARGFRILDGASGASLPGRVTYDSAANVATLAVSLDPTSRYVVQLPAVRGLAGGWTEARSQELRTGFAPPALLDPNGASAGDLVRAADGRLDAVYERGGEIAWTWCEASCAFPWGWHTESVGPSATHLRMGADAGGRVHVVGSGAYGGPPGLVYAQAGGGAPARRVTVDAAAGEALYPALAVEPAGRVRAIYLSRSYGWLRYAECAADCGDPARWSARTIAAANGFEIAYSALAVDAAGAVHVLWYDYAGGRRLRYATCAASCAMHDAAWTSAVVDQSSWSDPTGKGVALRVDAAGRLHASYLVASATGSTVRYATCAAACTTPGSWQKTTADSVGAYPGDGQSIYYARIELAPGGGIELVHGDLRTGGLRSASCADACTSAASWRSTLVAREAGGTLRWFFFGFAAGDDGKRRLLWTDTGGLRFMEF